MQRLNFLCKGTILSSFFVAAVFAQGVLSFNPPVVNLAAPAGSTKPIVHTVTLLSTGQSVAFDATVRYLSPATGWLSVSPATGTIPAVLTISADASQLPAGTHLGQVTATAGPLHTGAFLNVYFTVGSGSTGSLVVDPSGLTFIGFPGTDILPSQTIFVANATGIEGTIGFNASASSSGNWLSVSPWVATTPATLTVNVNQAGLQQGTYTGTITLTPAAGGPPTVVPVTLSASGTGELAPTLTLSQTAVTVTHQTGTAAPPLQVVDVDATGTFENLFTASTTTSWLSLVSVFNPTPATSITDFLPGEFSIRIDPAGLPPGKHVGTVTIAVSGLPPQQLPVALTVTSTPALNANPSSIVFDDTGITQSSVTVTSTGSASLSFTVSISPSVSWLTVTPSSGSTAGGSQVLNIGANASRLSAGTYTTSVVLNEPGTGAMVSIPVRFNVSGAAPVVDLQFSAQAVELTGIAGQLNPSRNIEVSTSTGGAHDFTAAASSTGGWLIVEPFLGTTPVQLKITANSAAVPGPGTYEGSVAIISLLTGAEDTITVTFNLAARAIVAEPVSLEFMQERKGVVPPAQSIQLIANTPSSFTVTSDSTWIKTSSTAGSTPSTLTVSVDPTGLAPGKSNGALNVTGPDNQLTIPVSLTIPEPPAPTATPESITLFYELGSPAPPPQVISIGSTGDPVSFTAAAATESGGEWLTVSPSSGSTPGSITATVDPALLVPGQHSGAITLVSTDGSAKPRIVPVTLSVGASTVGVQALLNAATLAPTPAAPGEIVTITGSGLGPLEGAVARPSAAGAIDTTLADVRVLFDGVPAPLLFVRNDQINAIVPYAIYGRLSTRVQVRAGSSFSIPIEVKVVEAAPGLFTAGSFGRGQAAALNADFTVNSLANPAQRGSVIQVFGTGEGQTDPPGQDGRIILTDLRHPRLPVVARIAGRPAQVLYAGSAPTLVSGVFQVNILIPEDIEPGTVPVEMEVGGARTQSAVTIAVR